jgi:large repetitive protein
VGGFGQLFMFVDFLARSLRSIVAYCSGLVLVAFGASPALAAPTPFTCTGDVYQVQTGTLRKLDPLTSTYEAIGTAQVPAYNAMGYNTIDNYAYAVQGTNLIRVGSNGDIEVLNRSPLPAFTSLDLNANNSGDVDSAGNLWVNVFNPTFNNTLFRKFRTSAPFTYDTLNLTAPVTTADMTFVPNGGTDFLIGIETGSNTLSRINTTTGQVTKVPITGLPTVNGGYGAIWRDSANRMFTFNNPTGYIFEIFNYFSATPSATLTATTTSSSNNDGFSCANAPFRNLQVIALPDYFTTALATPVSGNVIADNDTSTPFGPDRDPEGTALTVTTTPTVGPTNGTVVLAANGDFTYTPNPTFVGTDTFTYRLTDASGTTDVAVVQIIVGPVTANLVTRKSLLSPALPGVGETVTFQILVTNSGPGTASAPSLTDSLPAGITYSTHAVTQGTYTSGTGLWQIGRLASGQSATLQLSGTVDAGLAGQIRTNNTTRASQVGVTDPTTNLDVITASVTIASAGTSISKNQSGGPNPITAAGQLITYQIRVTNSGNLNNLTGVVVTDSLTIAGTARTLTSGPTFISGDTNGDNELDFLEPWTYEATYLTTQADFDGVGNFSNTASVDTTQANLTTSPAVVTPVTRTPLLTIDKIPSTLGPVNANDTITYTYNVTNSGNVTIRGIQVTDNHNGTNPFPTPSNEALVLPEAAPTGDSTDATPANAQWTILAPGDTVRFTANYDVNQTDIDTLQ